LRANCPPSSKSADVRLTIGPVNLVTPTGPDVRMGATGATGGGGGIRDGSASTTSGLSAASIKFAMFCLGSNDSRKLCATLSLANDTMSPGVSCEQVRYSSKAVFDTRRSRNAHVFSHRLHVEDMDSLLMLSRNVGTF